MMKNIAKIMAAVLAIISMSAGGVATAGWQGPTEVIIGSWGNIPGQFGIEYGDSGDNFPRSFGVTKTGKIVIADPINEVLHTFNSDGSFLRDIVKPVPRKWWPYSLDAVNDECAVVGYVEYTHTFNVATGALVGVANNMGGADYVNADCSMIISGGPKKGWKSFTPTGQLLQTYTERPLELGKVSEKPINSTTTKITVQYPDKTWSYTDVGRMSSYMRDTNGNLYGYGNTQVIRYATCGKEAAMLMMPKKIVQETSRGPQIEPQVTVLEEYGTPVIAPNGDVYTWKRTPTTYSILKWTWADDPNTANAPDTPGSFSLKTTSTGINLFWNAVPQDPGCLTGYELVRSTATGGPYTTLATINAGTANATGWIKYTDTTAEVGRMYYYKVRAVAGTEYSPYTIEVTGKR